MVKMKNMVVSCLSFLSVSQVVDGLGITRVGSGEGAHGAGGCVRGRGTKCILFFTGGSNLFQSNIYGEFIHALEAKDFDVYDVPFNYQISQKDIDSLNSKYYSDDYDDYDGHEQSVSILGHSSGCTTMLNQCAGLHGIKHAFLLDPVNTNFFGDKWTVDLLSLSFIHAMKSYKISFDPFGTPFIPIFKLTTANLDIQKDCSVNVLNIEEYGHSDILNQHLSDFMHNSRLSVGNKNRGVDTKKKYFDVILSFILETIYLSSSSLY